MPARLIRLTRLLLALFLVPWLVPSSASGQSTAYVVTTAPARGFISIVNTDTRQVDGTIELWALAGSSVSVSDLTVSADGRRLYVAMTLGGGFTFEQDGDLGLRYRDPPADHDHRTRQRLRRALYLGGGRPGLDLFTERAPQ